MLAAMSGLQLGLTLFYILVCILLIGVVLLQKGRGGGIGAAFGGGGTTSPFGAKTGDVFTWVTVVLAGLAIFIGVIGNYVLEPRIQAEAAAQARVSPDQDAGPTPTSPGQTPGQGAPPFPPQGPSPAPAGSLPPPGRTPTPSDAATGGGPTPPETEEPAE